MDAGGVSEQAYVKNEVWLEFADGEYLFKLKLPQLAELQEKCSAGIGTIYMRVTLGDYRVEDLVETIRLGLIGGGRGVVSEQEITVNDIKAKGLVKTYCDRPLDELHKLAAAVLGACVVGYKAEDRKPGNENPGTDPGLAGSISQPPTPMEPPLEG